MAITQDASTPAQVSSTATNPLLTTASFSPPSNSLVVVLAGAGYSVNAGDVQTCTVTSSPAVTWTVAVTASAAVSNPYAGGASVIAYHYYSTAPGAITVSNQVGGGSGGGGGYIKAVVLTGASSTQTGSATIAAENTAANNTTWCQSAITPTAANSLVYGLATDSHHNDTLTAFNANSTLVGTAVNDATNLIAFASFKAASATPATPAAITLGCATSATSSGDLAMFEVLPDVVNISDSDTGTGTDSGVVRYTAVIGDTGTGTDTAVVNVPVPTTDTGSGASGQAVAASLPASDTGSASEGTRVVDQFGNTVVSTSDSASSAEAVPNIRISGVGDTGSGLESSGAGIQGHIYGPRVLNIDFENRLTVYGAEVRTLKPDPETRKSVIPAETRTAIVVPSL